MIKIPAVCSIGVPVVAWLRGGTLEADKIETGQFDSVKARAALQVLRHLTREEPAVFLPELKQVLADAGTVANIDASCNRTHYGSK